MNELSAAMTNIFERDPGVSGNYQHGRKLVTPGEPLAVPDAIFKWYGLAPADDPVPEAIDVLARVYLEKTALAATGFGFVILHRCGTAGFYFLLLSSWRGNNEVWETVYYKQDEATPDFSLFPREGAHKPTFCVWELAAVWHEAKAWDRFLQSSRDEQALQAWLKDRFAGPA